MTAPAAVLIGPMGVGKSSVGRRVARVLHMAFFDTDVAVTRAHGPIPAIFAEHGEARFREWERAAVQDALHRQGIVALGGGAVLDADTRADLRRVPVVLLTVEPHAVARRIRTHTRPLLDGGDDAMGRWRQLYAQRRDLYTHAADVVFDTSDAHVRDVAADVAAWVRAQRQEGRMSAGQRGSA